MEPEVVYSGNDVTLRFSGVMDISAAREIRESLLDALNRGGAVLIDLAQTERLDASVAQLLISAAKASRRFEVTGLSDPVRAYLQTAGLLDFLPEPKSAANRSDC